MVVLLRPLCAVLGMVPAVIGLLSASASVLSHVYWLSSAQQVQG
jgi:hypothetical protein